MMQVPAVGAFVRALPPVTLTGGHVVTFGCGSASTRPICSACWPSCGKPSTRTSESTVFSRTASSPGDRWQHRSAWPCAILRVPLLGQPGPAPFPGARRRVAPRADSPCPAVKDVRRRLIFRTRRRRSDLRPHRQADRRLCAPAGRSSVRWHEAAVEDRTRFWRFERRPIVDSSSLAGRAAGDV